METSDEEESDSDSSELHVVKPGTPAPSIKTPGNGGLKRKREDEGDNNNNKKENLETKIAPDKLKFDLAIFLLILKEKRMTLNNNLVTAAIF